MSEPEPQRGASPSGSCLQVVIVDDNPDDRVLVSRVLRREHPDIQIEEVIDQKGLDRVLDGGDFDLVITDFQLKWSDGLAVLRATKARYPDRPVIMFTGTGSEEIAVEAMKSDLDDYVLKSPQHFVRLVTTAHSVLSRARERAASRKAEETLHSLKKAVDTLAIGVTIADTQGRIVYTNPAEALLHGYALEELIGKQARILVPSEYWSPMNADQIGEMKAWKRERVSLRKDGSTFPGQLVSDVVRSSTGRPIAVVTTCEDITERKRVEEQLHHNAFYDVLTGLPNRALFMDRLRRAVKSAHRHPQLSFAVLFLDLDRFKLVNDSFGHSVGDQLLVQVARRLEASLRPSDTVCRFGGDEFALLAEEIKDRGEAEHIAQRTQKELSQPYHLGAHEVFTSASVGIALGKPAYADALEVLRDADTAMYRAKAKGRARHEVFNDEMFAEAKELVRLDAELRRGLERGEFVVHYQPIVSLATGLTVAAEALVRWRHPTRGLLLPDQFIPLAEETGLITPLGEWVLREACRQAWAWREAGLGHLRVSVNISPRQFRQEDLATLVQGALEATAFDPASLDLELSESALTEHLSESVRKLEEVKALGVRISLDDFGTGYSSLNHLRRFPVDTLKIAQSFVQDITSRPRDAAIVSSVIALARSLKVGIVAEGVETDGQLAFLRKAGCEQIQGFVFSRALPSGEFEKIAREPFRNHP